MLEIYFKISMRTNNCGLQVHKHRPRHVLAGAGLPEERIERVIATSDGIVAGHLTIRLDTVLQTVQFPAGVTHLYASLTNMDGDAFTLQIERKYIIIFYSLQVYFYSHVTQHNIATYFKPQPTNSCVDVCRH